MVAFTLSDPSMRAKTPLHLDLAVLFPAAAAFALGLSACGGEQGDPPPASPAGPLVGGFMIEEVFYTGSPGATADHYFSDQFIEIVNDATGTLYADGLLIADVHGPSGEINPGQEPTPFQDDAEHVYVSSLWRVPGSGQEHPVAPGESIVIAQDGVNHQPDSALDLSDADFETYNERDDDKDVDWPNVPNLERLHFTGGFDWLLPVFGPAVVIFRAEDPAALEQVDVPGASELGPRLKVPNALVIDAFEALLDAESGAYKRVPAALDRGFVHASGTYTGESARRKVAAEGERPALADTDDSGADFEILPAPAPRQP